MKRDTSRLYQHVLAQFSQSVWAILPSKLAAIKSFLALKAEGGEVSAEDIALLKREQREPSYVSFEAGAVAHEGSEGKDDSSAWDGPAAESRLRKWASSDGSGDKDKMDWAKYRRGFAWYDASNEDSFGSYKLPHHDIKDGKFVVVLRGVEAAMAALLGGRGGTSIPEGDRKAVYNHLAAEYREFGKEPPDFHSEDDGDLIMAELEAAAAPITSSRSRAGSVAVLPLTGTISHRMGMMSEMSGGISTERFSAWLKQATKDPNVKAIVIDCDSPGGTVDGVPELGAEIAQAKASKPVVGVVNSMCASAAYWLLSQCSELVVTPSGQVGSIGVFAAHEDISKSADMQGVKVSLISAGKYKTEGNPFEPLSDEARGAIQSKVNEYYDAFTKAVAKGRGVDLSAVRSGFGEGRMVSANQAVKEKMADRVATLDQTLSRLGAASPARQMMAEEFEEAIRAEQLAQLHRDQARELEL